MRLRQLARKLGVHPDKILTLLADSGHELENEANSKLTNEQVDIAEIHFPPPVIEAEEELQEAEVPVQVEVIAPPTEVIASVIEEVPATEPEAMEAPLPEVAETVTEEKDLDLEHLEVPFGPPSHATSQKSVTADEATEELPETPKKVVIQLEKAKSTPEVKVYNAIEEDEEFINAELIKTEKPVLEGLKVVGKIELPEPKKPVAKTEEEAEAGETTDKSGKDSTKRKGNRNDRGRGRNGRNQRQRLSPLEYERQKAERLAKRKKQEAEKKLKQKKEEHYRATLEAKARAKAKAKKNKQLAKPKKQVKREEEPMAPLPINGMSRPKPVAPKAKKQKGPLKRFWGWLNGESDKFN